MAEEAQPFLEALPEHAAAPAPTLPGAARTWSLHLPDGERELILVRSGIGLVAAASALATVLAQVRPSAVVSAGPPGGLTSVHANDARSVHYRIAQLAMESAAGKSMPYEYILNTVRATIDVVCFFKHTYMTELYYDPVATYYALRGRA